MKKISILILLLVLGIASIGVGWAVYTKTVMIDGTVETGKVDFAFDSGADAPTILDKSGDDYNTQNGSFANRIQIDDDIGNTGGSLEDSDGDGNMDKLNLSLQNVYPGYYTSISFSAHNLGTVPIKVDHVLIGTISIHGPACKSLDLDGNGSNDIQIWWRGTIAGVYQPNNPDSIYDARFDIQVLDTASQGFTKDFTIDLVAEQSAIWEQDITVNN